MRYRACRTTSLEWINDDHFIIGLEDQGIGTLAKPGQFVMVKPSRSACCLARPYSFFQVDENHFTLLVKAVGKGSAELGQCRIGDDVFVTGPLGNFVEVDAEIKHLILVGGGVGAAALHRLADKYQNLKRTVIIGGASIESYPVRLSGSEAPDFTSLSPESLILCSDQPADDVLVHGLVTEPLAPVLVDSTPKETLLFACGPTPMMKAVAKLSQAQAIRCLVSVEEHMACGVGACMGCVCKTIDGYKRSCVEGPVFDAAELTWE